jgi:acetylornithine/N-succinyldiaminopimelate aminotransferase
MSHLMNTYARQDVGFTHGQGCWLFDAEGRAYLDALSGIAVSTLGHAHPRLVSAISAQAGRLLHASNLYQAPAQEHLADRLCAFSGMDEVFFCNSGCEANEAAIKLARMYGHKKGIEHPAIVVMEHAFHGRTLATLSATGNRKVQVGFEPLVSGFVRVPFGDLGALSQAAQANQSIAAVLVEPVQGEGGIHIAPAAYLQGLRALCDAHGWLLMVDEVQCGMGRTGRWFGFQHSGILPDVMSLAKGLASGLPMGACLTAGAAKGLFGPGNHGSTFGGNPVCCAAALETLAVIEEDRLHEKAEETGKAICQALETALQGVSGLVQFRQAGLMIGIELDRPCGELVAEALKQGLLINVTAERVVRLLPPLVFGPAEVQALTEKLALLIRAFLAR